MVDAAPIPSPFLRSWWLTATSGPRPRFLLAVDGERLLGGLALEQSRLLGRPCLRVMSSGPLCPDHIDLVTVATEQDTTARLLRAWLGRAGLLDLEGVSATSRLIDVLPAPVHRAPYAVAPWSPLPGSSEAYLATLTSQFRRQMRKASARLAAEDVVHRTHRGPSALRSLDTLRQLHQAQWGRRSRFLSHFDRFAAACGLGAEVDEVVVHELASEELVVATVVTFEVAGRVSLYQSARRTESHWREAMSVLLTTIITDACDRGLREVDLLRGDEPYKGRFTSQRRELLRLLAARGGTGRAAKAATIAASTTRRAAERAVQARRRARH